MASERHPQVSLLVLNNDGKAQLDACLATLHSLDYPPDRLELILVDHGSPDGSVKRAQSRYRQLRVVRYPQSLSVSRVRNLAAQAARGEWLAFLNSDLQVSPNWLTALTEPLRYGEAICATSRILTQESEKVISGSVTINFHGHLFPRDVRESLHNSTQPGPVLAPSSLAMLIDRQIFLDAGGFDEDLQSHFVGLDLGWRLWVMGYKVMYVPAAVARLAEKAPASDRSLLHERDALLVLVKNYDEHNLERVLPVALMLWVRRLYLTQVEDVTPYRSESRELKPHLYDSPRAIPVQMSGEGLVVVRRSLLDNFASISQVVDQMPRFMEKRREVQRRRQRPDSEIFELFGQPFEPSLDQNVYRATQDFLVNAWGLRPLLGQRSANRVLIVSDEKIGSRMAGQAARDWEYARLLSRYFPVTLASPYASDATSDDFAIVQYDDAALRGLAEASNVIVTSGNVLEKHPGLRTISRPLVVLLSHSFDLENLHLFSEQHPLVRWSTHHKSASVINDLLVTGDFFLCASERQRDYWLGRLSALNRVNPDTFAHDQELRKLIDVAAFGLPERSPAHRKQVLKGVWPGINADDKVLLWGGGIYDWLDPLVIVWAMDVVVKHRSDVKLFFGGIRHPSPNTVHMRKIEETVRLSEQLDLRDRYVFFNDWVPYKDRENYLLEADVGLSLHAAHIETRYSLRTRILDYIWAGLPMIVSTGDVTSELVQQYNLGHVVDFGDVEGVAQAILDLVSQSDLREQYRKSFSQVRERYQWERVLEPLIEFCRQPRLAPDRQLWRPPTVSRCDSFSEADRSWHQRLARGWQALRSGGWAAFKGRLRQYAEWKIQGWAWSRWGSQ